MKQKFLLSLRCKKKKICFQWKRLSWLALITEIKENITSVYQTVFVPNRERKRIALQAGKESKTTSCTSTALHSLIFPSLFCFLGPLLFTFFFSMNTRRNSNILYMILYSDFPAWCKDVRVWHEQQFDVQSLQWILGFYSGLNDNRIFENLRRRWGSKWDVWEKGNIKKGSKQINFSWQVIIYSFAFPALNL